MSTKQATATTPAKALPLPGPISFSNDHISLVVPPEVHQLDEFRRWVSNPDFPPNVRVFFNQGALSFDTSNEELETHNKVKLEVMRVLAGLNLDTDRGELYADGVLVTNEAAEVSNNPDAVFVSWETFDAGRVSLVARQDAPGQFVEIEGIPDWVLEVVSLSSVKKDTQELRQAYHRAGIPEYWLIDARKEVIDFQILQHRKSRYFAARRKEDWQWSNVFECWFRLERTKGRRDHWRYRLQLRDD